MKLSKKIAALFVIIFALLGSLSIARPVSAKEFAPIYSWRIDSKTVVSTNNYGSWRNGPSGKGPSSLTVNSSTSINRTFTNSLSGSAKVSTGSIGASLGVSLGVTKNYGTSYTIKVPKGAKRQIIFRPRYKTIKIVQRQWEQRQPGGKVTGTSKTVAAYVNVFENWDYSYKNVK